MFKYVLAGFLVGLGVSVAVAGDRSRVTQDQNGALTPSSVTATSGVFDTLVVGALDAGVIYAGGPIRSASGQFLGTFFADPTSGWSSGSGTGYLISGGDAYLCTQGNCTARLESDNSVFHASVVDAGQLYVANNASVAGALVVQGNMYGPSSRLLWSSTAPTVTACAGGTAATMTWSSGTAAFQFDVGTACTSESTAVLTMPAATTGWVCSCSETTADRLVVQRVMPSASTTQVTLQNIVISTGANGDWTDSADVACMCHGG